MDHAEAHELGVLEPGNQPQHARLLAPLHLRLEADQAEVVAGEVVLPQLHDRVRLASGARIGQADRLHRPEAQRVHAASAITSIGRQPSKNFASSNSCSGAFSAAITAS